MALNINREVEDTFYRYKMPKLSAKVEGKGNGIKTVIVNVSDIAKALNRKPICRLLLECIICWFIDLTKFFGCELGAQIHVDDKNERYIVNGAHEAAKLQELLDGFIKKFVLCQSCHNPETTMHVSKKTGTVGTICKACGSQGQLDVAHRLTQYIVKNPPEPDSSSTKAKVKKGKKTKNGDRNSDEDHEVNAPGGDETTRHSPTADAEDDDWVEDTTEEAQLQRMNELSAMAKSLALSVDVEKSETERADVFYKHLLQLHQKGGVLAHRREVKQQADSLELGPRAVLVLAEVLLSSPATILADVKKFAPIFMLFTRIGENQKRAQHYVLGAVAKLIERYNEQKLLSKACHILKALYDNDVIEEDVICAWYEKGPSKKFVSRDLSSKILSQCAPMVKWLQEAEEESDDSNETDDASVDTSQDDADRSVELPEKKETHMGEPKDESGSEDDIDIDAI
ncbi:Eukaryotic translation initiation factor 5 [Paragonimus heterotremus]|uniref:Eukaryotic translation initiation factor 5 n=1 Tax=Paragonimus heterotremus TaxID=100268 RepID=A0A8J4SRX0_9TREM|nr:Eukaryotic translation initiation factor 5 [Paragonimus heterotremus]